MVADLSVHAFDLVVPGGQLSLPVPLLAQPLPFCKHPPQQPLPNHDLTLHYTPTTTKVRMLTDLTLPVPVVTINDCCLYCFCDAAVALQYSCYSTRSYLGLCVVGP